MFQLDLEKAEELELTLLTSPDFLETAKELQNRIFFCFIDYVKTFDCVNHKKVCKILQEVGIRASWEIFILLKKQQLELDMQQ